MNPKSLFLHSCIVFSVLLVPGCGKTPETMARSSDGVKIAFDVAGTGEPTLVLVPGWTNDRTIWDAQVAHFSQSHQVVAIDLPGFGESEGGRETWTITAFGEDVERVVDQVGAKQVVLVGFSMGGPVVVEAARRMPDRVRGVVLVEALKDVDAKLSDAAMSATDSIMMDIVTAPTPRKLQPFFRNNFDASFRRVLAMLDGGPRPGWKESLDATMRWSNEDCTAALQEVKAPIIAINSDQTPTNVEAFRRYMPSFEAKIIPNVGHVVMWDAPDEFNRLLAESVAEFSKRAE